MSWAVDAAGNPRDEYSYEHSDYKQMLKLNNLAWLEVEYRYNLTVKVDYPKTGRWNKNIVQWFNETETVLCMDSRMRGSG